MLYVLFRCIFYEFIINCLPLKASRNQDLDWWPMWIFPFILPSSSVTNYINHCLPMFGINFKPCCSTRVFTRLANYVSSSSSYLTGFLRRSCSRLVWTVWVRTTLVDILYPLSNLMFDTMKDKHESVVYICIFINHRM